MAMGEQGRCLMVWRGWIVLAEESVFFLWAGLGDAAGLWGFDCRVRWVVGRC